MFSLILATDCKNGIGKNNQIPWNIPEDLKNFKRLTTNQIVIMGKNTWNSLPKKPLPNRLNIVISSTLKLEDPNVIILSDIASLLKYRKENDYLNKEWFIIGGATLYNYFFDKCNKLYWSVIPKDYECDVHVNKSISDFADWSREITEYNTHSFYFLTNTRLNNY